MKLVSFNIYSLSLLIDRPSEERKRETLHNGEQNTPLVDICCPFWLDFMSISYFFTAQCMTKEERTERERERKY